MAKSLGAPANKPLTYLDARTNTARSQRFLKAPKQPPALLERDANNKNNGMKFETSRA